MGGRLAEGALVTTLAVLFTLIVAAPVLRAPSDRIFGMAIVGRHHDPFTVMRQLQASFALGVYTQPLTDLEGQLLARTAGPVAAYNWLVILTFPLAAVAAYALARYLTLSPPAALIAALAFAFSPFHLAQAAYHPHIAQTQWVPLYFLALWRCLDKATAAAIAWLAVAIAAVTLSNFYGGLIAAVITPVAVASYWWLTPPTGQRSWPHLAVTLATLVTCACVGLAYVWYVAPAVLFDRMALAFADADRFRYGAKWWSYLVPPVENPFVSGAVARLWHAAGVDFGLLEQQVSLGWGIVTLAMVAVSVWFFRRRELPRVVPVLAIVAAAALACSLAPEGRFGPFAPLWPSAWLYDAVPMFRSYARFGVVVQLMAALLAGIGADGLWRSRPSHRYPGRIACAVLLLLSTAEYIVWPPAMWRDVLPTAAHRWVARQPPPIRVLDCAALTRESESIQWLTGNRIALEQGGLDDCAEPNIGDKLSSAGFTHLLVRRGTAEGEWFAKQGEVPGVVLAAHFADGDVFGVRRNPPLVYTFLIHDFYGREFDGASSWRWMGPEAWWTIINRTDQPVAAAVDIELAAFHGARLLRIRLDDDEGEQLTIAEVERRYRIGPLTLSPGQHRLAFEPAGPPTDADLFTRNGDHRPLSFRLGSWQWTVAGRPS